MWAHYSKNTGICIEFDGEDTVLQDRKMSRRITYTKKYPAVQAYVL